MTSFTEQDKAEMPEGTALRVVLDRADVKNSVCWVTGWSQDLEENPILSARHIDGRSLSFGFRDSVEILKE